MIKKKKRKIILPNEFLQQVKTFSWRKINIQIKVFKINCKTDHFLTAKVCQL